MTPEEQLLRAIFSKDQEDPLEALKTIARDTPEYVCAGIPDDVIEAGMAAREQAEHDMANYVSGVTTDWDEGMIAAAMFRAMLAKMLESLDA